MEDKQSQSGQCTEDKDNALDNSQGTVGAAGDLHQQSLDDGVCKEQVYREWAKDYDDDVDSIGYQAPDEVAKAVQEKIPNAMRILDAGCGTGLVGEAILKHFNDKRVVMDGCDLSAELMEVAREKERGYDNLCKVNLKETMPYIDGLYDAVVCCGVFLQGHCGTECLDEMLRVVKEGGGVVFTVRQSFYDDPSHRWQDKLAELEKAGHDVDYDDIQYLEGVSAKLITITV